MHNTIYLVGFMGAGKTTLARQVAQQYGYTCIDTDTEIEHATQSTIAQLFANHGEDYFRKLEADILRHLTITNNTIVATGGGLPCYHNNMEWMNQNGTTVYLQHEADELANRLKNQVHTRPILQNASGDALIPHIKELLNSRIPYYKLAKFAILGTIASPQTIINTVIS